MRVLVIASAYPTPRRPSFGLPVHYWVRHIAHHCPVVVLAPIPWFPFNRWLRGPERAEAPFLDTRDGLLIYYPRFLSVPALLKCLDGLFCFLCLLPLVAWLRLRSPFDLIDAHFSYPGGVAAVLLGKTFRRPAITTLRGSHDIRHASYRLRRFQISFVLYNAARVIAVSDSLRQFASELGTPPEHIRVIRNGVDASRFKPGDRGHARRALDLPVNSTILLSVGNLVEGKGHHRVLELLPRLLERTPTLLYVAIGAHVPGDAYPQLLHRLVDQHRLHDHVRILSVRPHHEIPLWMAAANLFCLATRMEGWCNALTEALACGLPVITTRVGGNTELVTEGRDGFLVSFWDASGFAEAIIRALEITWNVAEISERARVHGWERTAEQVFAEFVRCGEGYTSRSRRPAKSHSTRVDNW